MVRPLAWVKTKETIDSILEEVYGNSSNKLLELMNSLGRPEGSTMNEPVGPSFLEQAKHESTTIQHILAVLENLGERVEKLELQQHQHIQEFKPGTIPVAVFPKGWHEAGHSPGANTKSHCNKCGLKFQAFIDAKYEDNVIRCYG